jgi:5-methylcytosine-specific restriction endonuclease McrA
MTYISDALRLQIKERAKGHCEYCHYPEWYAMKTYEVDHIWAEKHGGETVEANLCLSCIDCNRHKGSDLCSLDMETGEIVSLYHPRRHVWDEHFRLEGGLIEPITPEGRVTVRLLRLNDLQRVAERKRLIKLNRYP